MDEGKVGDMGDAGGRSLSSLELENMLGTSVHGIPHEEDVLVLEELLICTLELTVDETKD